MKRTPRPKKGKPASPDNLIAKDVNDGGAELQEDDLNKVSGGLIALLNKQK